MREIAIAGLDASRARGAGFAEVRVAESRERRAARGDGRATSIEESETAGASVRVIVDGASGFASSARVSSEELAALGARACASAKSMARLRGNPVEPAPAPAVHDRWRAPFAVDPFDAPLEEIAERVRVLDAALRARPEIAASSASLAFQDRRTWYASSEGAWIEQEHRAVGARLAATAEGSGVSETRTFPFGPAGAPAPWLVAGGLEALEGLRLEARARSLADDAVAALASPACPPGDRDLILGGPALAWLLHATIGRALEIDRARGLIRPVDGGSFATPDKRGALRIGSEHVRVFADATLPGGLATAAYDDEGVAAQRFELVRDGVVAGFLTNREHARAFGEPASRGAARAASAALPPGIAPPNLSLLSGDWKLDDLVADTRDGVFADTPLDLWIDDACSRFRLALEAGVEIRDGARVRRVNRPVIEGSAAAMWGACDAVASAASWGLFAVPGFPKGSPPQSLPTSHGCAPARFRGVRFAG